MALIYQPRGSSNITGTITEAKIYALIDPRTDEIRYIGKTSLPLMERLWSHNNNNKSIPKQKWYDELENHNVSPKIRLLHTVSHSVADATEIEFIAHYKQFCNLLNLTLGGSGCKGYCPESFLERLKSNKNPNYKKMKPVLQYNLDGIFIKEWSHAGVAQKELGINRYDISHCCNKTRGRKTVGGFKWKFVTQ